MWLKNKSRVRKVFLKEGTLRMKKNTKDKIAGLASVLLGVILIVNIIPNWIIMTDAMNHTSPDTFPKFASYGLIILGLCLLIQAFMRDRKEQQPAKEKTEKTAKEKFNWKSFVKSDTYCALVTAVAIILFALLLKPIGYVLTGCICSVFLLVAFRSKKWYHYVIVIAFTLLLYFVFSKVLMVKVP